MEDIGDLHVRNLDIELLRRFKAMAARRGLTIKEAVAAALRDCLDREPEHE